VDKQAVSLEREDLPLGDQSDMVFAGTAVTYGRGTAIVLATGMGKVSRKCSRTAYDEFAVYLRI
jgi:magnesium-transporting ATPase (P-type)